MSMYEPDPGAEDESAGLDTSTTPGAPPEDHPQPGAEDHPQPGYMNPPEGNPIQGGAQAAENFLAPVFQQQGPMPNGTNQEPPDVGGAMGGGLKRLAGLVMGEGATSPQDAEKLIDQLKKQGMTDDDANLLAIHNAYAAGGPAAAWGMLQYSRMAFNAKQSFARVAMNGIDGKAGDISAAVDAATKAGAHVPDGSSVSFHADKWGVTATVSLPGTSQRQVFDMTPQQFDQYLDLSKTSQWDRLMEEGGIPTALTKVGAKMVRGPDQSEAPAGNTAKASADANWKEDDAQQRFAAAHPTPPSIYKAPHAQSLDAFPGNDMQFAGNTKEDDAIDAANRKKGLFAGDQPAIPGTHDAHGHYLGPKDKDRTNYGDELQARSEKVFGKGNVNTEGARNQWMGAQEEKELERNAKLDQANAKGAFDLERARVTGASREKSSENAAGGRVGAAQVTADGRSATAAGRLAYLRDDLNRKVQAMTQNHQDGVMREKGRMAGRELAATPGIDEAGIAKIYAKLGIKLPQADTPMSVTTQQPRAQQGKKFYNGQWYTKDEYMRDVLGQGQ